ncbi:MAG: glutaredoxin 3 [Halopseudomonas sp.]
MANIVIYSTAYCPFCIRAKALLEKKQAAYEEIRVDIEPTLRRKMMELSGGSHTVPQIFIDQIHIGGCDELYALERQNRLDPLLNR